MARGPAAKGSRSLAAPRQEHLGGQENGQAHGPKEDDTEQDPGSLGKRLGWSGHEYLNTSLAVGENLWDRLSKKERVREGKEKQRHEDHDPGDFEEVLVFGRFPLEQVFKLVALTLVEADGLVGLLASVVYCVLLGVCVR